MHHTRTEEAAGWPYASLFFLGFFGANDPGGKRLAIRGTLALMVFVVGAVILQASTGMSGQAIGGALIIGSVAALIVANARYLAGLDELSRRIQLEAYAWTYALAFLGMAIILVIGGGALSVNPLFLVALEPIRGAALVVVARKYA